jgi:hypothetical protein
MKMSSLVRVSCALHYTYMVDSPFRQRGGLLLIAGPGNMKSTIVEACTRPFPNALCYSDLTLKQLAVVRNQIANGTYVTLAFTELEKLYARNLSVAMNLEGVLKAMVEEGFAHFAFEDKRCFVPTARCYVMASVLYSLYSLNFARWEENGFLRRFLKFNYSLSFAARQKVKAAVHEGELIPFPAMFPMPTNTMRLDCSREESTALETVLGNADMTFTPLNLLRKGLTILKWAHKQTPNRRKLATPLELIQDLAPGLNHNGGELEL